MKLRHHFVRLSEVTLHTVSAGSQDDPLVILLHGFPEHWYGWHKQIPALAQGDLYVCAPDQRGYNLSDKPRALEAYNLHHLTQDVVGLIRYHNRHQAVIVGHDWGAAVGWWLALKYPQVVDRLIILNVPHPTVMQRFAPKSLEQLLRSWYVAFFQIPWFPEFLLRQDRWRAARNMMRISSRPDTFSEADLQRYVHAWSQPRAMHSMINWYRAAARTRRARLPEHRVRVPTRIIWGVNDIALSRRLAPLSLAMCDEADLHFLERATHWLQHEEPERVNELILDFARHD